MKRSVLLWMAAATVVVAHLWAPLTARRNQQEAAGGTLELTEHELAYLAPVGESTVSLLEFRWRTDEADARNSPRWLDQAKLAALGFDCQVALTAARARDHYRRLADRPAWLVLTLTAPTGAAGDGWSGPPTRLTVVDAGLDVAALRERYAEADRYALVRGVIHLGYEGPHSGSERVGVGPRLQGRVVTLLPRLIFVPRSHRAVLEALPPAEEGDRSAPARYRATVCWGTGHLPWLQDVRLE